MLGGTLTELAWAHGRVDELARLDRGARHRPHRGLQRHDPDPGRREGARSSSTLASAFTVYAEVGEKDPDAIMAPYALGRASSARRSTPAPSSSSARAARAAPPACIAARRSCAPASSRRSPTRSASSGSSSRRRCTTSRRGSSTASAPRSTSATSRRRRSSRSRACASGCARRPSRSSTSSDARHDRRPADRVGKRHDIVSAFARHAFTIAADPNPLAPAQYAADLRVAPPRIDDPAYVPFLAGARRRARRRRRRAADRPRHPRPRRRRPAGVHARARRLRGDVRQVPLPRGADVARPALARRPSCRAASPTRYPVMVKPRQGSGARSIHPAADRAEMEFFVGYVKEPVMVQRLMGGHEFSIDVLCDLDGVCLNAIPRTMLESRGGESIKGQVIDDPELVELARTVAETLRFRGPGTIQVFRDPRDRDRDHRRQPALRRRLRRRRCTPRCRAARTPSSSCGWPPASASSRTSASTAAATTSRATTSSSSSTQQLQPTGRPMLGRSAESPLGRLESGVAQLREVGLDRAAGARASRRRPPRGRSTPSSTSATRSEPLWATTSTGPSSSRGRAARRARAASSAASGSQPGSSASRRTAPASVKASGCAARSSRLVAALPRAERALAQPRVEAQRRARGDRARRRLRAARVRRHGLRERRRRPAARRRRRGRRGSPRGRAGP